ncbi:SURF1 family protein [Marinicauda algicola]|uniref:SURF1-like protein n=1 Tax=Marinicauda algicola TaxID=2029849 RepID=A0A4S2GWI9_9PROT|nr:SURF1 family protein [Marinicauda algicola]TGY87191.1 SURF1 family protein [Marinicauda algicola]
MHFRPLPLLTLFAIPALALLVGLGLWQLDRAETKRSQIAAFEAAREAPALALGDLLCGTGEPFGRRALAPEPAGDTVLRVYGRTREGAPGWRLFRPAEAPGCVQARLILMETGFAPLDGEAREPGDAAGLIYAAPPRAGAFTPGPEPQERRFYAFDRTALAGALSVAPEALHAQGWLAADDGQLPAVLAEVPPERHVGYAITWFGFAFALIVVYGAFHAARGRLAFTGGKD